MATLPQLRTNKSLDESGAKVHTTQKIIELIKESPRTLNDLARILCKRKGTISGRCSDLSENGLIKGVGVQQHNGIDQTVFGITPESEIENQKIVYSQRRQFESMRRLIKKHKLSKEEIIALYEKASLS